MAAPSLAGYVVGVTADRRADEQIELLRRRGATTLHGPSIKTLPLDAAQELRSITELLYATARIPALVAYNDTGHLTQ